jgi:transcription elongation factor Elf1
MSKPKSVDSIRGALRTLVSTQEMADLLSETLIEGLRSTKPRSVPCQSCGASVKVEVSDLATRVTAATKLLETIEGRLKDAGSAHEEAQAERVERLLKRRSELTDRELSEVINALQIELNP